VCAREAARPRHGLGRSDQPQVGAVFTEKQIYRIDHYLGKEAVQNLMALRFGNALFEPLWRRGLVKHVQITVAEELGVERRGAFYDKTGALRDMVQNHLLQLLCIMAMEPPASSDPDAVRDEKLKVLRALKPLRDRDVLTKTVRGQYKAGPVAACRCPATWRKGHTARQHHRDLMWHSRWKSTPGAGPACPSICAPASGCRSRLTELVVTFDDVPHPIFERRHPRPPTELVISAAAGRKHHADDPGQESRRGHAPETGEPGARPGRDLQDAAASMPTSAC
jgi:glucose-6-phosphate 1-dehydrogenase